MSERALRDGLAENGIAAMIVFPEATTRIWCGEPHGELFEWFNMLLGGKWLTMWQTQGLR